MTDQADVQGQWRVDYAEDVDRYVLWGEGHVWTLQDVANRLNADHAAAQTVAELRARESTVAAGHAVLAKAIADAREETMRVKAEKDATIAGLLAALREIADGQAARRKWATIARAAIAAAGATPP